MRLCWAIYLEVSGFPMRSFYSAFIVTRISYSKMYLQAPPRPSLISLPYGDVCFAAVSVYIRDADGSDCKGNCME